MAHKDTTDTPYNSRSKSSTTVFLGMKILTNSDGIWTSVQPKGVGWKWIPQRFIEHNSCHTHYTKWYMLKGLLIRALTICNNQSDFMTAVIYYTQGLISRGFPVSALRRAWRKFVYDKILAPATRKTPTADFEKWLDQQDFSQACLHEEQHKLKRIESTQHEFESFLINGLAAVNHMLKSTNCQPLTLNDMKQVAAKMAQAEASIIASSNLTQLHAQQPDNIQSADVILKVWNDHENILVTK